jgi:hypothetical protein
LDTAVDTAGAAVFEEAAPGLVGVVDTAGRSVGEDISPGGGPVYGTPYPSDPVQEAAMLKTQANDMRNDLDEINRRIEELEKESSQ